MYAVLALIIALSPVPHGHHHGWQKNPHNPHHRPPAVTCEWVIASQLGDPPRLVCFPT